MKMGHVIFYSPWDIFFEVYKIRPFALLSIMHNAIISFTLTMTI